MLVCVVLCSLVVTCWERADLLAAVCVLFVTFPNVFWSTSESRVRLAPWNWFKPSSKIFYWPFQGGTSFVDLLCFCSVLCLLCFVRVCLYVLCGHLLGKGWPLGSRLWCLLWVCHFPIGILGQVWYLIVSIPDLCNLITFRVLVVSDKRNLCFSLCNTPIPHRPLIPRIDTKDKYLDLWLNRTHFVKILTDLHSP